jgi:hypothetical protein
VIKKRDYEPHWTPVELAPPDIWLRYLEWEYKVLKSRLEETKPADSSIREIECE